MNEYKRINKASQYNSSKVASFCSFYLYIELAPSRKHQRKIEVYRFKYNSIASPIRVRKACASRSAISLGSQARGDTIIAKDIKK
jgi:hypothetical protein